MAYRTLLNLGYLVAMNGAVWCLRLASWWFLRMK
jgi:hypothetical protein